jgi:hypothetical protein
LSIAISCPTFDSCKRTTKDNKVQVCVRRLLHQLLRQSRILQLKCEWTLTAVPCGYLRLPSAICGRRSGSCFSLDSILKLLYKNSCLCLKNLLMSRATSITRIQIRSIATAVACFARQMLRWSGASLVRCCLLCLSDVLLVRCFPGQMFCSS